MFFFLMFIVSFVVVVALPQALDQSILGYLLAQGEAMAPVAAALRTSLGLAEDAVPDTKYKTLLEKKWTSVVRLQRKTMDLEARCAKLQSDLDRFGGAARLLKANSKNNSFPKAPAKYNLTGHRDAITSVALHPKFSLCASASEDSTVKVWDFESGEFEQTLKGHTNTVQCVAFDLQGKYLASCSADLSIKLWLVETFQCAKVRCAASTVPPPCFLYLAN